MEGNKTFVFFSLVKLVKFSVKLAYQNLTLINPNVTLDHKASIKCQSEIYTLSERCID